VNIGAGTVLIMGSLAGLVSAASYFDCRWRRIPNLITFGGMFCGVLLHTAVGGLDSSLFALAGCGVGFACLLPGYVLGQAGAGDVKLLGAVGTFLGPFSTLIAGATSLMAGAIMALCVACFAGGNRPWERYTTMFQHFWVTGRVLYQPPVEGEVMSLKFPFAPAIAIGAVTGAWYTLIQLF